MVANDDGGFSSLIMLSYAAGDDTADLSLLYITLLSRLRLVFVYITGSNYLTPLLVSPSLSDVEMLAFPSS